ADRGSVADVADLHVHIAERPQRVVRGRPEAERADAGAEPAESLHQLETKKARAAGHADRPFRPELQIGLHGRLFVTKEMGKENWSEGLLKRFASASRRRACPPGSRPGAAV